MNKKIFHFWGQFSRLRFVKRWSIKFNYVEEDCLQHSAEVAVIAHALATIQNEIFQKKFIDPNRVGMIGLFHDFSESITGDIITPAKKADPVLEKAYKRIEGRAEKLLLSLLPRELDLEYEALVDSGVVDHASKRIVKAADTIAALSKCKKEVSLGNTEFQDALGDIELRMSAYEDMEEVQYFLTHCLPSYGMTIDSQLSSQLGG